MASTVKDSPAVDQQVLAAIPGLAEMITALVNKGVAEQLAAAKVDKEKEDAERAAELAASFPPPHIYKVDGEWVDANGNPYKG